MTRRKVRCELWSSYDGDRWYWDVMLRDWVLGSGRPHTSRRAARRAARRICRRLGLEPVFFEED
jgi:hypothetical protein